MYKAVEVRVWSHHRFGPGHTHHKPSADARSVSVSSWSTGRAAISASGRVGSRTTARSLADGQDGEKFVFSSLNPATTGDELVAHYGAESWAGTSAAVGDMLGKIAQLYDPAWLASHGAAASISDFAERAGLGEAYTGISGEQWGRDSAHASERFIGEFMEGITRANVSEALVLVAVAVCCAWGRASADWTRVLIGSTVWTWMRSTVWAVRSRRLEPGARG